MGFTLKERKKENVELREVVGLVVKNQFAVCIVIRKGIF